MELPGLLGSLFGGLGALGRGLLRRSLIGRFLVGCGRAQGRELLGASDCSWGSAEVYFELL